MFSAIFFWLKAALCKPKNGPDPGLLFKVFHIDLGLGNLKVTFEDLIAALVVLLLFVAV